MNQQRETLPLFMDIFEPPPHWRTGVNIEASAQRSPLQHQPSLSEIIFQGYNNHLPDQNDTYRRHSVASSAASHDFKSVASLTHASSSQHQIETLGHHSNEESAYEDTQAETDLSQQQADDASLTASIFTAAEYSDDSDDNSSIKNTRHGHLSNQPSMDNMHDVASTITTYMKKLDIHNVLEWQDYRPQYKSLNESYDDMKIEIYNEIYSTMKKMQLLDQKFNMSKANFYHEMEKEYEVLSISLLSQCHELNKEKEEYILNSTAINSSRESKQMQQQNEKIKLNIGGTIFETSLSTLRRDTNSLLAVMFSGRHTIFTEADGSYFIDRDPSHFRLVLNYLRDFRIPPTILQDVQLRQELLQEAKYYGIDGLVQLLQE